MHTRIQALEDEHYNLLLPFNLALEINEAITNRSNTASASDLRLVGAMQGTTSWGWWWWGRGGGLTEARESEAEQHNGMSYGVGELGNRGGCRGGVGRWWQWWREL
jgi:hypothetical protein